jgi:hypothetical protein
VRREDLAKGGSRLLVSRPNYMSVITPPSTSVMTWLERHVPITLLVDLLDLAGPPSREIYRHEAVADDVRRDAETLASPAIGVDGQDFSGHEAAC